MAKARFRWGWKVQACAEALRIRRVKGAQKNKEKEYNPWEPKPIKPMESQSQDFISLEGNILNRDFVATNIEIDIRECIRSHCQLYIYNTPYSEEETLSKLNESASFIHN